MSGHVQRRPNGQWRARYRDPSGRERSRQFDRKIDAQRWLSSIDVSKSRGEWLDPALSRLRIGEWSRTWLNSQSHLKPSTRQRYEVAIRRQILPTWSGTPLNQVTHSDVTKWVQSLVDQGLAPGSVRYAFRVLSLVLEHAVRDGRLPRNPAAGVRLPRIPQRQKTFLTHEEVHRLAEAAGPYSAVILTLAYTGLRWGELAALRVENVDFAGRRLTVDQATVEVGGRIMFGPPKTHQHRVVPIPRLLTEELATQAAGKEGRDLLFTSPHGAVLRNGNFRRNVFDPAVASLGLRKHVTPHVLRHTAASLAVASGANVKAVQQMLGHASAAMTLDVYAGLFGDDLDAVADRLDEAARLSRAAQMRPRDQIEGADDD